MAKGSHAQEERNARILKMWNETEMTAVEIGSIECVTRETVCGVIFRARQRDAKSVTRPTFKKGARKTGKLGRMVQRRAAFHKRPSAGKAAPVEIAPELCRSMSEAVWGLRGNQCRFVLECDDPTQFAFCAKDRRDDKTSYCADHHPMVWEKLSTRRRSRQPDVWRRYRGQG